MFKVGDFTSRLINTIKNGVWYYKKIYKYGESSRIFKLVKNMTHPQIGNDENIETSYAHSNIS